MQEEENGKVVDRFAGNGLRSESAAIAQYHFRRQRKDHPARPRYPAKSLRI